MTVPLVILALAAAGLGMLGSPWVAGGIHGLLDPNAQRPGLDVGLLLLSNGLAAAGILLAFGLFGRRARFRASLPSRAFAIHGDRAASMTAANRGHGPLYTLLAHGFFIDELYLFLIRGLFFSLSAAVAWFDRHVVDGTVNLVGGASKKGGALLRRTLAGKVQGYALIVTCGVLAALAILLAAGFGAGR